MGRGTFPAPPFPRGSRLKTSRAFWVLLCSGEAFIPSSRNHFSQCQALLNKITSVNPQTEIDGLRNLWIIKPAAKSRGRGESQPGACVDSQPGGGGWVLSFLGAPDSRVLGSRRPKNLLITASVLFCQVIKIN